MYMCTCIPVYIVALSPVVLSGPLATSVNGSQRFRAKILIGTFCTILLHGYFIQTEMETDIHNTEM